MSTLYHATGIVLSRRDHKEVDRWYSVFTKEHGKIELLARGGHKPLAKLTPHLESVAEVDLHIVRGRYYDTVAGVERRRNFPFLSTDLTRLSLTQGAFHLVDIGIKPHETDEVLYGVLEHWLDFLEKGGDLSTERSAYLLSSFALKLISLFGYRPELHRCLQCKNGIQEKSYRWHALKGGVICDGCLRKYEDQYFSARPIGDEALKLLRFAMSEGFHEQLRPHLPGEALGQFHEAVESLIISHFPTIPASSLRAACTIC